MLLSISITRIPLNRDNKPKEEKKKESIILNDNLEFEINSEVKLLSLVSDDNKVKIVSEDEIIDTSSLGEKEITIKYLVKDKEEAKTVTIKIVDTQAPTIEYNKELSTNVGTKIDLLKNVKVSDNSKEKIKATVEGEYDFDNEGTYKLKYVAVDSSKNKAEKEFTLKVDKKTTTTKATKKTTKPQANNNSNNSNNTPSNNIGGNQCSILFDKYSKMYDYKFTKTPEEFSPEKYVTIYTVKNPVKFHYEWFFDEEKWHFVDDSGYIYKKEDISALEKLIPPPSRKGERISNEENGITYYTGEKTSIYQAYAYGVAVIIPDVCQHTN